MSFPIQCKKKYIIVFSFHTIKLYRSKGIAPLILNLVTRQWCVVTSCLSHFTPRKEPWNPLNRRLVGPQTQSGHFEEGKKYLAPSRIQTPDCPAHSQSLYWLHYSSS